MIVNATPKRRRRYHSVAPTSATETEALSMNTESLPFSPTRAVDGFVFLSGQGGFVPETGELAGNSIDEQTEQTLRNIAALLAQHGCTLADVVSCLVHLSDLNDFRRFNEIYATH